LIASLYITITMELAIGQPITLKCGLTLPNRLTKAAMAERLADKEGLPGGKQSLATYSEWAKGGWGLIISGTCYSNYRNSSHY
jgi:2,4-dienoyl-CoA reductase-like NADH-dependent reductase (Old Yellow Enzyme family)